MKVEIIVTDSEAIMSTPMGGNVYNNSLIITKEAFIECYEKWVKPIGDDKVEVVRCRDCKWIDLCKDPEHYEYKGANGFCSKGERKQEVDE